MRDSNLLIVLRPIEDGTARFIGESCIYILGLPINKTLAGDYWDLHGDWDRRNENWYPIDFEKKENWKSIRIIWRVFKSGDEKGPPGA